VSTALITGATAGIGAAFAQRLAADGHDLVLVARDEERLAAHTDRLATAHNVHVRPVAADLTTAEGIAAAAEHAATAQLLVNNAGFGAAGRFLDTPVEQQARMLRLHCEAVLHLTHAALPAMLERDRGGIINVASVAAFLTRGTYGACKSWIVDFTRSLTLEYAEHHVHFTALCPGFVRTELHQRAGMDTAAIPAFMWLSMHTVIETALRDLRRGKTVSVPGLHYRAIVAASAVIPPRILGGLASRTGRAPLPSSSGKVS